MLANTVMWVLMLGGGRSSEDEKDSSPLGDLNRRDRCAICGPVAPDGTSRSREFLADESGARMTGDTLGLAAALRKSRLSDGKLLMQAGSPAIAHLFIVNGFYGGGLVSMFITNLSTEACIHRLQSLKFLDLSVTAQSVQWKINVSSDAIHQSSTGRAYQIGWPLPQNVHTRIGG
jgi:heat shock protein HtpX